jgi:hypothetical protein
MNFRRRSNTGHDQPGARFWEIASAALVVRQLLDQ